MTSVSSFEHDAIEANGDTNSSESATETDDKSEVDTCHSVHDCEALLLELKKSNLEIFNAVSALQNSLKEERSKSSLRLISPNKTQNFSATSIVVDDRNVSTENDDIAVKSGNDSFNSSGSAASEPSPEKSTTTKVTGDVPQCANVNLLGDTHHQWVKRWISRPLKCLACMIDLQLYCYCAECYICKVTIHQSCAENLRNTCGQAMLSSYEYIYLEEALIRKFGSLHMCGWVKIWRRKEFLWKCAWACIQDRFISLFASNDVSTSPIDQLDLKHCTVGVFLPSTFNAENPDFNVPSSDRPFYVNIVDKYGKKMHLVCPDLVTKQKWLGAIRKSM